MGITSISWAEDCGVLPFPVDKIEYGCGCGYLLKESDIKTFILETDIDFKAPRIWSDGEILEIEPKQIEQIPINPKVGDKFTQTYTIEDISLDFTNTVSFVCPKGTEGGCEVTRFKSILKLQCQEGARILALYGYCGC